MIYWNTAPGAEYDITVPNQYGITPADVEGMTLRFEVRGNVELQTFPSGVFPIDAVTPGWIVTHHSNSQEIHENDFPPDGEYSYRAFVWDPDAEKEVRTLSEGVMVFGKYKMEREQYDKAIEYEQYN